MRLFCLVTNGPYKAGEFYMVEEESAEEFLASGRWCKEEDAEAELAKRRPAGGEPVMLPAHLVTDGPASGQASLAGTPPEPRMFAAHAVGTENPPEIGAKKSE